MKRVAVLASGGGSNLQAILNHLATRGTDAAASVVLVASDRRSAGALERASRAGIKAVALENPESGNGLMDLLQERSVDLVALAGFLRMVPAPVTTAWRGRMINVHPALLPSFGGRGMYGIRVHEAVLAHGAAVSGPTVHFVNQVYDTGPIIAQWPVRVLPDDTPATLAARVLQAEHFLYPRVLEAVASGAIALADDDTVHGSVFPEAQAHFQLSADPG